MMDYDETRNRLAVVCFRKPDKFEQTSNPDSYKICGEDFEGI